MRDQIFDNEQPGLYETFEFNDRVVQVFDDMLSRSVPCYQMLQELLASLSVACCSGNPIYDLGCSTGNTLELIAREAKEHLTLVGIDSSAAMLDHCRRKIEGIRQHTIYLECLDLGKIQQLPYGPAGVIVLSLVAQFIRPPERPGLLRMARHNLAPGGYLLMVEKTVQKSSAINSLFIDRYHEFKSTMGYSRLEIAKKREALENRLIPYRCDENLDLLQSVGFDEVALFFTWLNFQGYIARKS